jgi:hypothetical protein
MGESADISRIAPGNDVKPPPPAQTSSVGGGLAVVKAENVPINEIVNFLSGSAPGELERLKIDLPEISSLFQVGVTLGETDVALVPLAKVAQAGLKSVVARTKSAAEGVAKRIRTARVLRIASQIAAAAGSSSVIGFVFAGQFAASLCSGVVALFGSVASIFVDFFNRKVGTNGNPTEYYAKLRQSQFEAEQLLDELDIRIQLRDRSNDETRLVELVKKVNTLARKMNTEAARGDL